MPITSGQINQSFAAQQSMFGGQMAYAQQLSYPMQSALQPGMPPPPPPSAVQGFLNAQPHQTGMVGEQMAAQGVSGGLMAGGMAMSGLQLYGMMGGGGMMGSAGRALDPFSYMSAGFRGGSSLGGRMGMGMLGRGAMGALGGGAAALPIYGAYKAATMHMNAFQGGMEDQVALNSTLRGNFQHFGGQGAHGRGFSQRQMGQIGMDMSSVVKNDPFMSMGEATSLVGQGAQGGMFTGVREVSEFNQKFRTMLETLKGVQRELGGSLTDAMKFVQEAKQSGVFQQSDRLRLATGQRTVAATTGLNSMQQAQMTQFGAQLSRAVGGRAAQGAFGAQRTMQQVGAMVQSGALNEEQIYEITGQTGAEGQMAFAQNMMQKVARFSKRPAGRYSIFGLAGDESGRDLDPAQLQRFLAGDMGVGELSQRAHGNVSRMGRARAINQEGRLRGALLEQGGMAGQVGIMRMMVGDRVLQQDDDLASLVLQRRFGMGRGESEAMMSMMRNQGSIAQEEQLARVGSAREMRQRRDLEERSFGTAMDRLGSTVAEGTGLNAAREAGQKAVTKLSSLVENMLNDMLGVVSSEMTTGTSTAVARASIGQASSSQMGRLQRLARASGEMGGTDSDPFARGGFELSRVMGGRATRGEVMSSYFGRRATEGMSRVEFEQNAARVGAARQGIVRGASAKHLANMAGDSDTTERLATARVAAFGIRQITGGEGITALDFMNTHGGDERLAATALMARQGINLEDEGLLDPTGMSEVGGTTGSSAAARMGFGVSTQRSMREVADMLGGNIGGGLRALTQEVDGRPQLSRYERGLSYISRGGITRRTGGKLGVGIREAYDEIGQEGFESILQDSRVTDILGDITSSTGKDVTSGIERLSQYGNTLEGNDGRAVAGLVSQLSTSARRNNGRVGSEFSAVLENPEEIAAFRRDMKDRGRFMTRLGFQMGGKSGDRFSRLGANLMGSNLEAGVVSMNDLANKHAMGSEEEARELMASMGSADLGDEEMNAQRDALMGSMSRERALQRDLTGGGRRGQRQARETAFSLITGGTVGGMDFEVGGRRVRGREAQNLLSRALSGQGNMSDEQRQELRTQLVTQMQSRGIGGAEDLVSNLESALSTSSEGERVGQISREEAESLRQKAREHGGDISEAQQKALAEAQARANPLDTERNQTLKEILQAVRAQGGDETTTEGGDDRGEAQ